MRRIGLWLAVLLVVLGCPEWVHTDEPAPPRWVQVETTAPEAGGPAARAHHGAVYDPVGHRMILFGGRSRSGVLNDTWALDLKSGRWSEILSDVSPAARRGFVAVYDAPRRRMVIFSGQAGGFFNDVWALDLEQGRWAELKPKAAAGGGAPPVPRIRYGGAAIYDERRERLVTFAGFTSAGRFDDTWAFDLKEERWIDLAPPGPRPSSRCLLTAAHDALGDRMIVYAGQKTGALNDTWAYDLERNVWTEIKGSAIPPGRFFSALIYEPEQRRGVLFGGQGARTFDDTWALTLGPDQWAPLALGGDLKPPARSGHTAVYDPVGRRMLIFGGEGAAMFNDVWALADLAPKP